MGTVDEDLKRLAKKQHQPLTTAIVAHWPHTLEDYYFDITAGFNSL